MARTLPRLRRDLDFMPSPVADRPGLLLRDPLRYSPAVLILPPPLVPCLALFDGAHDEGDLRAALVRITGDLAVSPIADQLQGTLRTAGFLDDDTFAAVRDTRHAEFARESVREAAHAGTAYPDDPTALRAALDAHLFGGEPGADAAAAGDLVGIAAPHVSPEGGWRTYAAAYRALRARVRPVRTAIVLGTSHHGERGRFGLTRKPFRTPLGTTAPAAEIVDRLARDGGPAVRLEDYCHAVEHSIEFQVLFLQHLLGPGVRVAAVLCGPPAPQPEDAGARAFVAALRDVTAGRDDLLWVLGVDLAHVGRRYGDGIAVRVGDGVASRVAEIDRQRLRLVEGGEAAAFRDTLEPEDPLKWCGSAPLLVFLAALPEVRGTLLGYEQWNIDDASVVSFAALAFHRA